MLSLLLIAILGISPGPVPFPADSGKISPVVGINEFASMGSASYGPGIPSPTIDCVADGAGGYTCTGATATAGGTGTTSGTSPFWYAGDSAVKPSTVYNGSGWHDLGNIAGGTSLTDCAWFSTNSIDNAVAVIGGKSSSWRLRRYGSGIALDIYKAGGSATTLSIGSVAVGSWNAICISYALTTDGASIALANLNGAAVSRSDAVAIDAPALNIVVGAEFNGSGGWIGSISRWSHWTGFAATAAQLATMTRAMRSLIATKPSTSEATHTRVDATLCCPYSDAECYWLAPNVPCIHAPSYTGSLGGAGIEVYGPGENALPDSDPATWSLGTGVTATSNSASCPADPTKRNTYMTLVESPSGYAGVQKTTAGGKIGRSAWFALAVGDSSCTTWWANQDGNDLKTLTLTAVPVRAFSSLAGGTGFWNPRYNAAGACARWCISGAQLTQYATAQPFRSTTGTSYLAASGTVATTPQVAGATTKSVNGGATSAISADPIPIQNGTTRLAQCKRDSSRCK